MGLLADVAPLLFSACWTCPPVQIGLNDNEAAFANSSFWAFFTIGRALGVSVLEWRLGAHLHSSQSLQHLHSPQSLHRVSCLSPVHLGLIGPCLRGFGWTLL